MNNEQITFDLTILTKKEVWLTQKNELLNDAIKITIVSNQNQLNESGTIQAKLNKHIKELSKDRLELTRQIDAAKKTVMDVEKDLVKELENEHDRLKELNNTYATMIMRQQEEERRRIAKEQQAEAERKRAEEERQRAEIEEIKSIFGEEAKVPEVKIPEVIFNPAPKIEKLQTQSISFIETWNFEIIDQNLLPREFLMPDERKIRQLVTTQKETAIIPGVKIFKTTTTRIK